jgi:hypothetical protein
MSLRPWTIAAGLMGVWMAGCGLHSDEPLFGVFDDMPPVVTGTLPETDWIQVPTTITVQVWFSEAVDPQTVWRNSMHLLTGQDLAPVYHQVEERPDGRGLVRLIPREPLLGGVDYVLRVTREVTDWYGNPLQDEFQASFRTLR